MEKKRWFMEKKCTLWQILTFYGNKVHFLLKKKYQPMSMIVRICFFFPIYYIVIRKTRKIFLKRIKNEFIRTRLNPRDGYFMDRSDSKRGLILLKIWKKDLLLCPQFFITQPSTSFWLWGYCIQACQRNPGRVCLHSQPSMVQMFLKRYFTFI